MGQRGFTYLWLLFLIFLIGLGAGKSLEVYSFALQREKHAEDIYREKLCTKAIAAYYDNSPGYQKQLPKNEDDLLLDPRLLTINRYLRSPDPTARCPTSPNP